MKRRFLLLAAMASLALLLLAAPAALAQDGDLTCAAFANQETAQAIVDANPNDIYDLDADGNGVACEDAGTGTAEDGTLAPFATGAQGSAAPETLADTGGLPLIAPVAAAMLLAACAIGLFLVARRRRRASDAGNGGYAAELGPNSGRALAVALAAALAVLLSILLGAGVVGPVREAEAQRVNPLFLTTSVHPSPTDSIPLGTRMDFLITEQNVNGYGGASRNNVTVYESLPAGVRYVSATPSQGSCAPMADRLTIECDLGTIRAGYAAHVNVVVEAVGLGRHTNSVSDSSGNEVSAPFTIVRRLY